MFGIGIAALVVLVETEWHRFLALVPLLDAWLGRGILQVGTAPPLGRAKSAGRPAAAPGA